MRLRIERNMVSIVNFSTKQENTKRLREQIQLELYAYTKFEPLLNQKSDRPFARWTRTTRQFSIIVGPPFFTEPKSQMIFQ